MTQRLFNVTVIETYEYDVTIRADNADQAEEFACEYIIDSDPPSRSCERFAYIDPGAQPPYPMSEDDPWGLHTPEEATDATH